MKDRIALVYYGRIVGIDNITIIGGFYFLFKFAKRVGNAGNELAFGYIVTGSNPALEEP